MEFKEASLEHNPTVTPIQKFYGNSHILITGASGFFGKILVEKLLRSCPDLSIIYILVRHKKGKDMKTRVTEILNDVLFERLKTECPDFRNKVVGIDGDCSLPNLGLSLHDRHLLIKKVNIIFHVAATVNLNEKLKRAVFTNVRATKEVVSLAQQLTNLKALMYVSTAYSNCNLQIIKEKIYPPAFDNKDLILLAEILPDAVLDNITEPLLGNHPNTYTFTKQISEDVINKDAYNLPAGIVRPAIAVSTYKEPIKYWIDNPYGPTGIVAYASLGILPSMYMDKDCKANVIPVDMCVNMLITAAWDVGMSFQEVKGSIMNEPEKYEIPVYHYESNSQKPITWGEFFLNALNYGVDIPTVKAVLFNDFKLQKNLLLHKLRTFIFLALPAFVLDLALLCIGKSPQMVKTYSNINKFCNVLSYFTMREWTYKSPNAQKLIAKMSDVDKTIFFCDLTQLQWEGFLKNYYYGIRLYFLKDPIETIPAARRKRRRLYWIHQLTKVGIYLSLMWIILRLLL